MTQPEQPNDARGNAPQRCGAIGVIVDADGRMLVIERSQTVRAPGRFCFPGGGIEPGETEQHAVKRELLEELGIHITDEDIDFVHAEKVQYLYPPEDPYYIFKGQQLSVVKIKYNTSMNLIPQDDEFDELCWIKPQELINFDVGFRLSAYTKALEFCGLFS